MSKYGKVSKAVEAIQWNRLGDHPAVTRVPSNHPAWNQPQQAERCGWIDGQFVHPGSWIVESNGEQTVVDAFAFDRDYQPESSSSLPDIETVSAEVHEAWMDSKRAQGIVSRKSETGEELMVPYEELSEAAKQLDRGSVLAVYAAIKNVK